MEIEKKKLTRKNVLIVTMAAFLVIMAVFAIIGLAMNDRKEEPPQNPISSNTEDSPQIQTSIIPDKVQSDNPQSSECLVSAEESSEADASQTFAESSIFDESDESVSAESSIPEEIVQGWVINEYGYTYVYGDSGYEQFNFGTSSLNRYADCLNSIADIVPESTQFYNITVPVSATFVDIPYEIRERDNYFNRSQAAFVSTVNAKLNERIINIPIVPLIEEKYNEGEYVFYRTDRNWTQLGAYAAYTAFCDNAGITPYELDAFEQKSTNDYLGSFYHATGSELMKENPDEVVCYSTIPEVKTALLVYDSDLIYDRFKLCDNKVSLKDAYDIYLGTVAERYEINTTVEDGSLLIIGDSSVYPIVPFLACHYNKIDVINPEYFDTAFSDFFSTHQYDDILTMCYSTNAVNGNYIPAFNTLTGVTADE